jgi:hypothetical protein
MCIKQNMKTLLFNAVFSSNFNYQLIFVSVILLTSYCCYVFSSQIDYSPVFATKTSVATNYDVLITQLRKICIQFTKPSISGSTTLLLILCEYQLVSDL